MKLHLDAIQSQNCPQVDHALLFELLTIPYRVGHPVFRALVHCGPLCLAKQLKLLFTTSPKTLFVTSEQKWSFCNSIIKVYSEQLFANKMNNLEEFLERYDLPRLNQRKQKILLGQLQVLKLNL